MAVWTVARSAGESVDSMVEKKAEKLVVQMVSQWAVLLVAR